MAPKIEGVPRTLNQRTPNTTRCLIVRPFADPLGNLVAEGEEDEGENLNLGISKMQMLNL
jgi:hypothetical protein